jgi:hypothetical protein
MAHWHSTPGARRGWPKSGAHLRSGGAPISSNLYHTGRWKRYYSEEQFLLKMREAIKATDRWAEIAPTPPRTAASEPSRAQAATPQRSAA